MSLPDRMTTGEKYGPAMEITDPKEAQEYFEECVIHCMRDGMAREEAETIERSNLGYYAGYYNPETRARVERLFNCAHPFFGAIATQGAPTPTEAFELGKSFATIDEHDKERSND